jgi:hypothetical protein
VIVLELVRPGHTLVGIDDAQDHRDALALYYLFMSCVDELAVSLSMYEDSAAAAYPPSTDAWREQVQRDAAAERSLVEEMLRSLPAEMDDRARWDAEQDIRVAARRQVRRRRWEAGELPNSYRGRAMILHAKSFVYALDSIREGFKILAKMPIPASSAAQQAVDQFDVAFPDLRDVRDSAHHAEDRIRARYRKTRINLKPIDNGSISAPAGGALVTDSMMGNRYGGTLSNGSYGEVEVSVASAMVALSAVQDVINASTWRGDRVYWPL